MGYEDGTYWKNRSDLMYYQYFKFIIRCIGPNAKSIIDVGSGNSPYLEWFDWIPRKLSVDIRTPYSSEHVQGIQGDIHKITFDETFDICTCLQVLEHITEAGSFANRLLEIGKIVLISVPYKWPAGSKGHVQDPVDLEKVVNWFQRTPNWSLIVQEPFVGTIKGRRMFALFDVENPNKQYEGTGIFSKRRPVNSLKEFQLSKNQAIKDSNGQLENLKKQLKAELFPGMNYYCPVCEKNVDSFLPYGKPARKSAKCPNCGSLERHRLAWLFFKQQTNLFEGNPKRLLHVAPERGTYTSLIENIAGVGYLSADLNRSHAMLKMDLTDIQFRAGVFDVILCSHVLEHIQDDIKAMTEMFRVLKPGGWLCVQVPIKGKVTYEDAMVKTADERMKRFGQHDHVRIYGTDIANRLHKAGFNVEHHRPAKKIGTDYAKKMALADKDIFLCVKDVVNG